MDREAVKAATGNRKRGGKAATEYADPGKVSEIFPPPTEITLKGRTFTGLEEWDANDIILIESHPRYGSLTALLEALQEGKMAVLRDVAWFVLRKSDPEITIEEVGKLLPIKAAELFPVIQTLFDSTGLNDPNGGGAEETEETPESPTAPSVTENSTES